MKPPIRPENPEWDHSGMIHWDLDTSQSTIPFSSVIYLTDTVVNQGGLKCVPGFHKFFQIGLLLNLKIVTRISLNWMD